MKQTCNRNRRVMEIGIILSSGSYSGFNSQNLPALRCLWQRWIAPFFLYILLYILPSIAIINPSFIAVHGCLD